MAELWNTVILEPMLNGLIAASSILFGNFGLAIIALTVVVRLILYPLTLRQLRSTKAMTEMQPKLQELQKKYKDKEKLQREMTKLYREVGVNPMGCLWPMLVQFPIWIALYQSIMRALAATPEDLLNLSQHLYSWSVVYQSVPVDDHFLWLNLSKSGDIFLVLLVGVTTWLQQKMVMAPAVDPKQQSMNRMMLMMMPLMFALFTLSFPSGLALYWVVSNIIGIGMQYFIGGWGYLKAPSGQPQVKLAPKSTSEKEKELKRGRAGDKR